MNDQELTALAAKAFGNPPPDFSPLTDDGDALRLAVSTRINIYLADPGFVTAGRAGIQGFREPMGNDPGAATRRAVVMAAAEIGRSQHA